MWPVRTVFRLSPMTTSMTGGGFGKRATGSLFSAKGLMDTGLGVSGAMGSKSQGVMPPSFGYPFYQPPSFLLSSSAFMGM